MPTSESNHQDHASPETRASGLVPLCGNDPGAGCSNSSEPIEESTSADTGKKKKNNCYGGNQSASCREESSGGGDRTDEDILSSGTVLDGELVIASSPAALKAVMDQMRSTFCDSYSGTQGKLGCSPDSWMWRATFESWALVGICSMNPSWCGLSNDELQKSAFNLASQENGPGTALKALLPSALRGGRNAVGGYTVYIGMGHDAAGNIVWVYSGITRQTLQARQLQHIRGNKTFKITEVGSGLTRGEASAIEQALIRHTRGNPLNQNIRNSISPKHYYQKDAIRWGEAWLRARGGLL